MRSGILLAIVGAWLVLRTVRKDATDRNLVDRILGAGANSSSTSAAPPAPRTPSHPPPPGTMNLPPLTATPPVPTLVDAIGAAAPIITPR